MQNYVREDRPSNIGEYDLFVGLDVDKSSISVSVSDGHMVIKSLTMPYDSHNLLSFIDKHYPSKR